MALLDFLKNKKAAEKAKSEKKPAKVSVAPKVEKTEKPSQQKNKKTANFSFEAVKEPHISEKSTDLSAKNQYTFKVSPNYNKNEIKKSVEGIYGVDVLSVNIIKIPSKKRRLGKTEGFKKAYKKAVVKIKEGQKIEIL